MTYLVAYISAFVSFRSKVRHREGWLGVELGVVSSYEDTLKIPSAAEAPHVLHCVTFCGVVRTLERLVYLYRFC